MHRDNSLPAVQEGTRLRDALQVMLETKTYHVLVLKGELVTGILSAVDLARLLIEKLEAMGDVERGDVVRSFFEERVERCAIKPVIVVERDISLREAARIMFVHRIGCLPVIEGDRVVGAILERDVVKALAESGLSKPVIEFATKRVVYVSEDSTILEALGIMVEGGFRRLPVLARGALAGIVTIPSLLEILSKKPNALYDTLITHMKQVPTVELDTPVNKAAKAVLEGCVGAVVVTHGGSVAGIFTERDCVRVYSEESQ